jgi:hypothetical protein
MIFRPTEKAVLDPIVIEQHPDPIISGIEAEFAGKVQKVEESGFDIQKYCCPLNLKTAQNTSPRCR